MKTLVALFLLAVIFCSCKKEEVPAEATNQDLNPVAVKIYVNDDSTNASLFIRVQ